MSQTPGFDFSQFVPGIDFLKNLQTQGAAAGLGPSSWVAPTLDPQELEKRIQELKAVQFWLNQNTQAIAATIQALEVQRMTLNTLKGMNLSMGDLAQSLKISPRPGPTLRRHSPPNPIPHRPPRPSLRPKPKRPPKPLALLQHRRSTPCNGGVL